jgi:hypothetical protein
LIAGAVSGMTTTAGTPARRAAIDRAMAWFPEE